MMEIPFTKLHGAENDFLLTWRNDVPQTDLSEAARRICNRNTGIGADGWMIVDRAPGGLETRLFNSDGSEAEISGNGTRCAAAFALFKQAAQGPLVIITTAAGEKRLRLLEREGQKFMFEMDMGQPKLEELHAKLVLDGSSYDATVLNVGNPQCAIFVDSFPANWLKLGQQAERHPRFPRGSNVSFVRVCHPNALEVLFFERGAGETRSSGTGSTGAATAAILRKVCRSPVEVRTPAGALQVRWDEGVFLTGPAELIGEGRFLLEF